MTGIPILDAAVVIGGLVIPPIFDFIKKKFVKEENDTPERTMGTLATTKPEALADYTKAMAAYYDSLTKWFNRDVTGSPSQWVTDLRASIRPATVIICTGILIYLGASAVMGVKFDPSTTATVDGIRVTCEAVVSSWMGDRISVTGLVR